MEESIIIVVRGKAKKKGPDMTTRFNLSAAANYAIIKGLEMMGWDSWNSDDLDKICAGLYWVNEVIDNVDNYYKTRNTWEKVERELTKAWKRA